MALAPSHAPENMHKRWQQQYCIMWQYSVLQLDWALIPPSKVYAQSNKSLVILQNSEGLISLLCFQHKKKRKLKKKREACSTGDSQAVSHPSTKPARRCLTSVFRWEPVFSTWYGRRQWSIFWNEFWRSASTQQR